MTKDEATIGHLNTCLARMTDDRDLLRFKVNELQATVQRQDRLLKHVAACVDGYLLAEKFQCPYCEEEIQ